MTSITIDHSRADMERRMRLLEMAGGDLKRAMELEGWVQLGVVQAIVSRVAESVDGGERAHPQGPELEASRVGAAESPTPTDARSFDDVVGPLPAHLVRG